MQINRLHYESLTVLNEIDSRDLQLPPVGLEREIIDKIKSMSGVDS